MSQPTLTILVGNIASGKTTLSKKLSMIEQDTVVISRDAIRYMLGAGKYLFDPSLEKYVAKANIRLLRTFLNSDKNIILDEVNNTANMRNSFTTIAREYDYYVRVLVMPKYSMKYSVDRRMKDPHGDAPRSVWEGVWKKFNESFEPPTLEEDVDEVVYIDSDFSMTRIRK